MPDPSLDPLPEFLPDLSIALAAVRQRIADAAAAAGRTAADVRLLAVSKTFAATHVRALYTAGQRAFGESYVQEAIDKMAELAELRTDLEWHFIGPVQSNKTRHVAEHFDWVQSVDRLKIAQRLSEQRPAHLPPLNICLQVNISGEASKAGVAPDETLALARQFAALPRLRLRGLMAIPAAATDAEAQREPLRRMRDLYDALGAAGLSPDTLSMGMSGDLEAAIAEGATLVRIGTALFGTRPAR